MYFWCPFILAFLQQAENDVKNLYNLYTNDRQETLKKVSIDEIATTVKSLKKWCPAVALSRQDGHNSAVALLLKAALIQVSDYRLLGASVFF
jgi:hypothetical protein